MNDLRPAYIPERKSPAADTIEQGLICRACNSVGPFTVTDTRHSDGGIRRRRICSGCGYRFTTRETADTLPRQHFWLEEALVDLGLKDVALVRQIVLRLKGEVA